MWRALILLCLIAGCTGRRRVDRGVAVIALLLLCLIAGCTGNGEDTGPGPVNVVFLGGVKLYQPSGQAPEPRYLIDSPIRLRFDPLPTGRGQCNPFAGGRLDLAMVDPEGKTASSTTVPLQPPYVSDVSPGYLLESLPPETGSSLKETEPPRLKADRPGRWTLALTWRCRDGSRAPRRTEHRVWAHPNPKNASATASIRERLAAAAREPAAARAAIYRSALEGPLDPESRLWLHKEWVQVLKEAGDFAGAEAAALTLVAVADTAGFPSEAILAWNAAHEAARGLGQLHRASQHLDRSLALTRSLDFQMAMPAEMYARAWLLNLQGRPLEALEAAADSVDHARRVGDDGRRIHAELLSLELLQALGHHQVVNRRATRLLGEVPPDDATALNNLGWVVLSGVVAGVPLEGNADGALTRSAGLFQQALELHRKRGDVPRAAQAAANLAEVATQRRDAVAARTWLAEARAGANAADEELQAFLGKVEGDIALIEGRPEAALERFREVEAIGSRQPALVEYAGAGAFGQGRAFEARGELEAATAAYDRALGSIEEDEAIRSPIHRAALLAKRALWEAGAVRIRLARGKPMEALEVVERGTWSRRQSLTRSARQEQLSAPQQAEIQALRQKLEALDREITQPRPLSSAQAELVRQEEARQQVWAQIEMHLDRGRGQPPPLELGALRSQLPSGALLLRFAVLPETLVVWELSRDRFRVRREAISRSQLEQNVEQFARSCRAGAPDRAVGDALRRLLLGDLEAGLAAHADEASLPRLLLVADGSLRGLPWSALPVDAQHLIERADLQLVPGLLWRPTERTRVDSALIVTDPGRDLVQAAREGQTLQGMLPAAELLERESATRSAVLARLPRAALFHFAGHGMADPERPWLSYLQLARLERLSLMEIQGLRLNGPLVFLNACSVGQVAKEGGGALGLAEGFLAAGAHTVIASLWEVPDREGAGLAQRFYQARSGSASSQAPVSALGRAQRRMVQGGAGPAGRSPAVWAAYLALGEFDR